MTEEPTRRRPRRLSLVLAALLAVGGFALGDAATAGGPGKVVICHATASSSNPWVRIEVSENALPAHLGEVGNSHQHQQALGRHDFVWTSDYDEACVPIPVNDPITVECSGSSEPVPVVAVDDEGGQTTIPCPTIHSQVTLPLGVHQILCTQGSTAVPKTVSYWLHPGGVTYVVNCLAGDIVDLGVQGGPVQVLCPAEGSVSLFRHTLFGIVSQAFPCTAGQLVPSATTAIGPYTGAIAWTSSQHITGLISCPAAGDLELVFLGEGPPSTSPSAATAFPCTPGAAVDVTRLVLTA